MYFQNNKIFFKIILKYEIYQQIYLIFENSDETFFSYIIIIDLLAHMKN